MLLTRKNLSEERRGIICCSLFFITYIFIHHTTKDVRAMFNSPPSPPPTFPRLHVTTGLALSSKPKKTLRWKKWFHHHKVSPEPLGVNLWEWTSGSEPLGVNIWEWTSGSEHLGMKTREWTPGSEPMGVNLWEWTSESESVGVNLWGEPLRVNLWE